MRRAGRSHRNLTHVLWDMTKPLLFQLCGTYLVIPLRDNLFFFFTICEVAWPTLEAHWQGKANYRILVCNANQGCAWDMPSLLSAA